MKKIKYKGETYHIWYGMYLMGLIGANFGFFIGYLKSWLSIILFNIYILIIILIGRIIKGGK